jgi:hypothetical protein
VIEIAVALFDFDARSEAELSFKKDQYIEILKKTETVGWWKGRLRGTPNTGLFPSNYAKVFYTITEKDAVRTAEGIFVQLQMIHDDLISPCVCVCPLQDPSR